MKILLASTLRREVTPTITASRSRIIYDLVSGLIKRGHKVTILGTANSRVPGAKIIPVISKGFLDLAPYENPFYAELGFMTKMVKMIEKLAPEYDIIHSHGYPEFINLFALDKITTPMLTTIHLPISPEMDETLSYFSGARLVCLSNSAKKLTKKTKIYRVVYNGIDTDLYKFNPHKEDYLLWIGRLGKARDKNGNFMDGKGVRYAIKLAQETDSKLLLGGNVEDGEFFNKDVKPHLSEKIKWICPISFQQPLSKQEVANLMGKAKAFLMTTLFQESFGLVTAEAMSCGTPVIGFSNGATKEIIQNGKTGFLVDQKNGVAGLKKALAKIDQIKPEYCRQYVETNFSLNTMINNYEKIYRELIAKK